MVIYHKMTTPHNDLINMFGRVTSPARLGALNLCDTYVAVVTEEMKMLTKLYFIRTATSSVWKNQKICRK